MGTRQQENVSASQIFSQRLATLRGNRSKRSFCKEIGVNSPQTYQHYENGRVPDMDTLVAIADRCGVTVDYLLGREAAAEPGMLHGAAAASVLGRQAREKAAAFEAQDNARASELMRVIEATVPMMARGTNVALCAEMLKGAVDEFAAWCAEKSNPQT
jgi:transcriptional regulator with XRE-family HTH domain